MELFTKRQGLSQVAKDHSHSLFIQAMTGIGQTLAAMDMHKGGRPVKETTNTVLVSVSKATLAEIGIDAKTSAMAQQLAALPSEQLAKVEDGTLAMAAALREVRNAQPKEVITPPTGEYSVILADPPWRYDFAATDSRQIENQYPSMENADICAIGKTMPFAKNSVLYLWATAPKLLEALAVIEAWGFKYVTNCVWDKEIIGMGYWFRGQHELLLVATKGTFSPPAEAARVSSVIRSRRSAHSAKPAAVYELIEAAYPEQPKLEMFCRMARTGWIAWGNQVKEA